MGFIRFALKSTITGSLVYYTAQGGLWSTPDDTLKLYCRIYNSVAPYIQKNIPQDIAKEIPELPSASTLIGCSRGMWNKGVMSSIKFVSELPTHVSNGIDYVLSAPAVKDSVSNVKGLLEPDVKKSQ